MSLGELGNLDLSIPFALNHNQSTPVGWIVAIFHNASKPSLSSPCKVSLKDVKNIVKLFWNKISPIYDWWSQIYTQLKQLWI